MQDETLTYSQVVKNLSKPGQDIVDSITAENAHLMHMAIGIAGEAGELLDAVKKAVIYEKPLDVENVIEELSDLEFYMEGLRAAVGVTRDQCIAENLNKLLKGRYKTGSYSNQQAQDRADKQ